MKLHIKNNSILSFKGNTIVNTANSSLSPGKGLDGMIRQFGGENISIECQKIIKENGFCEAGNAVRTTAGNLLQDYVIHAVGPLWKDGNYNEEELLKQTYLSCLKISDECNTEKVAFPCISTGIFGFPKEKAAKIAVETMLGYSSKKITDVFIYCTDIENFKIYNKII